MIYKGYLFQNLYKGKRPEKNEKQKTKENKKKLV